MKKLARGETVSCGIVTDVPTLPDSRALALPITSSSSTQPFYLENIYFVRIPPRGHPGGKPHWACCVCRRGVASFYMMEN